MKLDTIISITVSVLGLIVLVVYAIDTRKLRIAAERQIIISQEVAQTAIDQAEGTAKPCMTIRHKIRNANDTLLAADGAISSVVVDDDRGQYVAVNIGNGPALNVSYYFRFRRDPGDAWQSGPNPSYLPSVGILQTPLLALLVNLRGDEHEILFLFQSLGGRWYESVISIRSKAIIDFGMRQLPQGFKPTPSYKPCFGDGE